MNPDQSNKMVAGMNYQNRRGMVAFSYQQITVAGAAETLTIPSGAKYAEFEIESSVTTGIVARYLNCAGSTGTPTSTLGLALSHLDRFDILGEDNLANFIVIEAQAATTYLNVQYWK